MSLYRAAVSLLINAGILSCAAFSQLACVPKQQEIPKIQEPEILQNVGSADSELSIDQELFLAATSPGTIVESNVLSVSELEEHRSAYGDSLELTVDALSFDLPTGLLQLEKPSWSTAPAPGSSEARTLARINTQNALCSAGETVCITSPYGVTRSAQRIHKGIDIRAPLGSPIMAFRSGTVAVAQYHRSYGYMVDIQQDDGIVARYAHMSQILVRKGDRVTPGLMIGRVGSTGRSTGPHLHFELLVNNKQTNPMAYLATPKKVVSKGTEADAAAARKALSSSGKTSSKAKKTVKTSSKKTKKASPAAKSSPSKKTAKKQATEKKAPTSSKKEKKNEKASPEKKS